MPLFKVFGALCLPIVCLAQKFSLSDLQWSLRNSNGSINVPAQVPSQAHLDLLRAGIITEPLLGANGMSVVEFPFHGHISNLFLRFYAEMGCQ